MKNSKQKRKPIDPREEAMSFVREQLAKLVEPSGFGYAWKRENHLYLNGADKGRFTPEELAAINKEILAIHKKFVIIVT